MRKSKMVWILENNSLGVRKLLSSNIGQAAPALRKDISCVALFGAEI